MNVLFGKDVCNYSEIKISYPDNITYNQLDNFLSDKIYSFGYGRFINNKTALILLLNVYKENYKIHNNESLYCIPIMVNESEYNHLTTIIREESSCYCIVESKWAEWNFLKRIFGKP